MRNVVLTGFMGTGKSSVGRVLAKTGNYRFRDLDKLIVRDQGKSVNEIFAAFGESYFRELETKMLRELVEGEGQVISTGGGAVVSSENRTLLHRAGVVVNLVASPETILSRLEEETDRPLIQGRKSLENIRSMLVQREPYYADADIRIDTDGKNVEDVVHEIDDFLKGLNGSAKS